MSSSKQSGDAATEEAGVKFLHSSHLQGRVSDPDFAEQETGSRAIVNTGERDICETSVSGSENPLELLELLELVDDGECAVVC